VYVGADTPDNLKDNNNRTSVTQKNSQYPRSWP
jgi:hypothetical protein